MRSFDRRRITLGLLGLMGLIPSPRAEADAWFENALPGAEDWTRILKTAREYVAAESRRARIPVS